MIRDISKHRRCVLSYVYVPVILTIMRSKSIISDQMKEIRKKNVRICIPSRNVHFRRKKMLKFFCSLITGVRIAYVPFSRPEIEFHLLQTIVYKFPRVLKLFFHCKICKQKNEKWTKKV